MASVCVVIGISTKPCLFDTQIGICPMFASKDCNGLILLKNSVDTLFCRVGENAVLALPRFPNCVRIPPLLENDFPSLEAIFGGQALTTEWAAFNSNKFLRSRKSMWSHRSVWAPCCHSLRLSPRSAVGRGCVKALAVVRVQSKTPVGQSR